MADYGLKIFDASGNVKLDLSDKITRLRYSVEASAGVNGSTVLSDISGKSTCEFGIALELDKTPHLVERSGTTISWTAKGNTDFRPSSKTLVVVFLYT